MWLWKGETDAYIGIYFCTILLCMLHPVLAVTLWGGKERERECAYFVHANLLWKWKGQNPLQSIPFTKKMYYNENGQWMCLKKLSIPLFFCRMHPIMCGMTKNKLQQFATTNGGTCLTKQHDRIFFWSFTIQFQTLNKVEKSTWIRFGTFFLQAKGIWSIILSLERKKKF